MPLVAVLTGDLINFTQVTNPAAFRNRLLELMDLLQQDYGATAEVYRGDGFQVAIDADQQNPFLLAMLIRTGLISQCTKRSERWDARIAIACAAVADPTDQNSSAFVESGRTLDGMGESHLEVCGRDRVERLALGAATGFADDIINNLTRVEAEALHLLLRYQDSHQSIAARLNKKRPTVTLALQRARYQLLDRYINDMHALVKLPHEAHR